MKIKGLSFLLAFAATAPSVAQQSPWPLIQPVHEKRTFHNANGNADTAFVALVNNAGGVATYKVECHNGNYDDDSEIVFSGTFHCALFGLQGERTITGNLLAEDTKDGRSTDWFNRGRMLSTQLNGSCAGFPEYERVRHFKLRRMFITLQFSNLEWSKPQSTGETELSGFTVDVSVLPDKTARTPYAAVLRGAQPPKACY